MDKPSYDPECAKLASHFFGDTPVSQVFIDELAQAFQDAAEEACLALERRKEREAQTIARAALKDKL